MAKEKRKTLRSIPLLNCKKERLRENSPKKRSARMPFSTRAYYEKIIKLSIDL